ncbi:hypothetical protein XA68_13020 [Ophiocordyceps unilateralis]|uniref:Uncharacterized protein n=1 Tax=Ophiocordyceps unilateralis TaxID=268505 RepID=A0A2A9PCM4_OPHUN|nr:hypothetical protein XA68_13020 [Ophiocordyceps unilateralis]
MVSRLLGAQKRSESTSCFATEPESLTSKRQSSKANPLTGFFHQLRVLTSRTPKAVCSTTLAATRLESAQEKLYSSRQLVFRLSGSCPEVYHTTIDISTFDREDADHCVDAVPFIVSLRLVGLPMENVPVPLLFSHSILFEACFDWNASKFFTLSAITLVNHYIAVTCAGICVHDHFALEAYTNMAAYAFAAYAVNEFEGSFYDCPDPRSRRVLLLLNTPANTSLFCFNPDIAVVGARTTDKGRSNCSKETKMTRLAQGVSFVDFGA